MNPGRCSLARMLVTTAQQLLVYLTCNSRPCSGLQGPCGSGWCLCTASSTTLSPSLTIQTTGLLSTLKPQVRFCLWASRHALSSACVSSPSFTSYIDVPSPVSINLLLSPWTSIFPDGVSCNYRFTHLAGADLLAREFPKA